MAELVIKQIRSSNGASPAQRDTLRTLGLHGIGTSTERTDDPTVLGMVKAVSHLVQVGEVPRKDGEKAAQDG